jgi:osmotically inducible protein OsmC
VERTATAVWNGRLRDGNGTMSSESGVLKNAAYTFVTRFENQPGSNPEELVGAAHAGCFSMALSGAIEKAGHKPERIATTAHVTLEKLEPGFTVTEVRLVTRVRAPGMPEEAFETAAENARMGCPISRLLNTKITLDAQLEP